MTGAVVQALIYISMTCPSSRGGGGGTPSAHTAGRGLVLAGLAQKHLQSPPSSNTAGAAMEPMAAPPVQKGQGRRERRKEHLPSGRRPQTKDAAPQHCVSRYSREARLQKVTRMETFGTRA